MTVYWCEHAWLGGSSPAASPAVAVTVDQGGTIGAVSVGVPEPPAGAVRLSGVVMPGLVNAHSHAFHRALRGHTHQGAGDFWAWRSRMYELAGRLEPSTYLDLATATFAEMALAGITCVGEFHYVHHQRDGSPYDDHHEMELVIVEAARRAGVRLTLLDVGYLHAGLDAPAPLPEQRRFSDGSVERWLERALALGARLGHHELVKVGLAPHSVRAVHPNELGMVAAALADDPHLVAHVHASEQPAENEACLRATGLTPIGVLASVGLLGPRVTAVHATHLSDDDLETLSGTATNVCLCPTTERDLADGIGAAHRLHAGGAGLCVGTDSNAVIDLFEEARAVELDVRLATLRRGNLDPVTLLGAATAAGAASLGWGPHWGITAGAPGDLVALSTDSVRLAGFDPLDAGAHLVYAAAAADVRDVVVGGRHIVRDGHHLGVGNVVAALRTSMRALMPGAHR